MARLRAMARTDGLLGIANRAVFMSAWSRCAPLPCAASAPWGVLMVDVDCFKAFNDHYGHLHGDACLQKIAKALTGCLHRTSDLVARYGGEELVVLLPDTNLEGASRWPSAWWRPWPSWALPPGLDGGTGGHHSVGVCAQIPYARPGQRQRFCRPAGLCRCGAVPCEKSGGAIAGWRDSAVAGESPNAKRSVRQAGSAFAFLFQDGAGRGFLRCGGLPDFVQVGEGASGRGLRAAKSADGRRRINRSPWAGRETGCAWCRKSAPLLGVKRLLAHGAYTTASSPLFRRTKLPIGYTPGL